MSNADKKELISSNNWQKLYIIHRCIYIYTNEPSLKCAKDTDSMVHFYTKYESKNYIITKQLILHCSYYKFANIILP